MPSTRARLSRASSRSSSTAANAIALPASTASADTVASSISSSRRSRPGLAPSACITASSRRRASWRASSIRARLAAAISSTSRASRNAPHSAPRVSPTSTSSRVSACAFQPDSAAVCCSANARKRASSAALAWAIEVPGCSRPISIRPRIERCSASVGSIRAGSGRHSSVSPENTSISGGSTPITSTGASSISSRRWPITAAEPPNWRCHSPKDSSA